MSTQIAVRDKLELAKTLAVSTLLPAQYRQQPGNVLYALEYAEALGVHAMTAITGIHVIEGKPSASAQLIAALVRRAGHLMRVSIDRGTMTARAVVIRADDPDFEFVSEWTMERAEVAGLTGKKVWKQFPDAMLKARSITEVARDAASETLFGILYTAEELGSDQVDRDGAYIGDSVTVERFDAPAPAPAAPAATATSAAPAEPVQTVRDWAAEADQLDDVEALRDLYLQAARAGADQDVLAQVAQRGQAVASATAPAVAADEVVEAEVVDEDGDLFAAPAAGVDPFALSDADLLAANTGQGV